MTTKEKIEIITKKRDELRERLERVEIGDAMNGNQGGIKMIIRSKIGVLNGVLDMLINDDLTYFNLI